MCDLKDVAERVADQCSAIAVRRIKRRLKAGRSSSEGPSVYRVRVIDVDVQERGEQFPYGGGRDHDQGVTDAALSGTIRRDLADRTKHSLKEVDLSGHVAHDDAGCDCVVPGWRTANP
jgi:hypothetical protein